MLSRQECFEFLGAESTLYVDPTEDRFGVFSMTKNHPGMMANYEGRRADMLKRHAKIAEKYPGLFDDFPDDRQLMYYWPLNDVRCQQWYKGRVVLVGDSVMGFLPTAGLGASMAMESAAVLADELSRTDTKYLSYALQNYQARRKARVERLHTVSRWLARWRFISSPLLTTIRNRALVSSIRWFTNDLRKTIDEPI